MRSSTAHHRSHAGKPEALAHGVFLLPHLLAGHVHGGDEVAAQECGEGLRVHLIVLDLRIGDDAVLLGVEERDLGDARTIFEQVVERGPVPTRLDHCLARLPQGREAGGEGFRSVVVDASLLQLAALRVQGAGHRITFVVVDSSVVHGTASRHGFFP